ncbi:MAG TPA: glycosyltransferase family A protein [Pyrinomonadaceae bacterium]|nr:glycosyltransferase family A protein [Pyrinomonadaceae bacterium]
MSDDLVSIIMPAYNAEKYIAASIESVLAQTYAAWELIVVDDGSTDKTAAVVNEFVKRDSRIKYLFQENGRLGKARNTGIRDSAGPLVAFLDSDDLWMPTRLEAQTRAMAENRADVVYSKTYVFSDENINAETETLPSTVGKFSGPDFFDSLVRRPQIPVLTVLLKRSALDSAGLFEEGKAYHGCEDYDLWLRLARAGFVFYGMSDVLARYRRHQTAMTAMPSNMFKPMLLIVRRYIDQSGLSEFEKKRRITGLYRELVAALIDEGKISEAKQFVHELYSWNKNSVVTKLQKLLISIWPRQFNFISRECLYRTEWHLQKVGIALGSGQYRER